MANRKISDLAALTTPASGDYLPIVDVSEAAAADKNKRITIEELMRGIPDGTAGAPGIAFEADPNTGIYSPGADQVAISTGGTGRLFIDSSGRLLIGTSSSRFYTELGELKLQVEGTSWPNSSIGLTNNQTTIDGAYIAFAKTRGTSVGSLASVQGGDLLGSIWFQGANGTALVRGGVIQCVVDGTPGANDMPGSLSFSTTAAGASIPTERARIDSSGRLLVGTSSNSGGALLQVNGNRIRVATAKTPASASDTGTTGEVCWDASYIYVCTATNTWKRAALATW